MLALMQHYRAKLLLWVPPPLPTASCRAPLNKNATYSTIHNCANHAPNSKLDSTNTIQNPRLKQKKNNVKTGFHQGISVLVVYTILAFCCCCDPCAFVLANFVNDANDRPSLRNHLWFFVVIMWLFDFKNMFVNILHCKQDLNIHPTTN